jgi:predicted RNA-binding protein with PIN domain
MALIIDGYNVLFAIARFGGRAVATAIEEARSELLEHLLRCYRLTGERVTVVFDSRQLTGGARAREGFPGIRIVHAHPPRTADDEIRRLVEASTAPRHLRVVTSDRELARSCSSLGATVIGARAFFREITRQAEQAAKDEEEERVKTAQPSRQEMEEWLRVFAQPDLPGSKPLKPKKLR